MAAEDGSGWGVSRWSRARIALVMLAVATVGLVFGGVPSSARADGGAVGYDVSFPQCNQPFPTGGAFAIVGVNAGLPFSPNPCLGTGDGPSELQWAGAAAQLYANTADPGPLLSSHWPNGQTAPQQCNTAAMPGADTVSCAYDYGWNAMQDSYQDAVNAYISIGLIPTGSTRTPSANTWWLDVEAANSWETNPANNLAALQGGSTSSSRRTSPPSASTHPRQTGRRSQAARPSLPPIHSGCRELPRSPMRSRAAWAAV